MRKERRSIGRRIQELDVRIIYFFIFLAILIPYFRPIGLPIEVTQYVNDFYLAIEELPEDSVVVFEITYPSALMGEYNPNCIATINHLFSKNVKVVIWTLESEGTMVFLRILEEIDQNLFNSKIYGEDYVILGFSTGEETAQVQFGSDLHSLFPYDYLGTSLEDLPMMEEIRDETDMDMIIVVTKSGAHQAYTYRTWYSVYNKPLYIVSSSAYISGGVLVYPLMVQGFLYGIAGAAQYEYLLQRPGQAIAMTDIITVFFALYVAFIMLGNVGYYLEKYENRRSR